MQEASALELRREIKLLILETLNIKNIQPDDIDNAIPIFSKDSLLALDSIDGIELIMAIQKKYNVRIADQNLARSVLESVNSIAEFVEAGRKN